jgi:acylglycerol lipase
MSATQSALLALCVVALSFGCSTPDPSLAALDPDVPQVTYYTSTKSNTVREERTYIAPDGQELAYLYHHNPNRDAKIALVYLHGIESHAAWFDRPADMLTAYGFDVYCIDRRGSGMNRENRGITSGDVDTYQTWIDDLDTIIGPLDEQYDKVILMGLSWGGKLAMGYALEHPEDVDGLILITPGFSSKVPGEFATAMDVIFSAPEDYVKIPIEPEWFTETPEYLEKLKVDPLRLQYATGRFFIEGERLDGVVSRGLPTNQLPLLLILAGQDKIIDNPATLSMLQKGQQDIYDIVIFSDQTHSVQFDAPKRLSLQIVAWLAGQGITP